MPSERIGVVVKSIQAVASETGLSFAIPELQHGVLGRCCTSIDACLPLSWVWTP